MATKKKQADKSTLLKKSTAKVITNPSPAAATKTIAAGPATITVTFTGGVGKLTATLFQNLTGAIIGHDSVDASGSIVFNNANTGDAISINGACSGKAVISINVATDPTTPVQFSAGSINFGFDIL